MLIFTSDLADSLVVLDLAFKCGQTVRLAAIYSTNSGQSEYFRDLKRFLSTLHSFVLLGYLNTIHKARVDSI